MALASASLSSCSSAKREHLDAFRSVYDSLPTVAPGLTAAREPAPQLWLTAVGVPLVDLLRQISDEGFVSVIAAQNLDKELISLEVKGQTAEEVLGAVARRLGQRLAKIGGIYYIGQIAAEDRGFIVRRVHRLRVEELDKVLGLFMSEFGKNVSFTDGLLVAADRVEVLDRLSKCLDKLENTPSATWLVQLYVISLSESMSRDLGIDLQNTIKLSLKVNNASSSGAVAGTLDALLVSTSDDSASSVIAQPLLLIRDGGKASISDGTEQPIPKYTNLTSGNLELSGFEIVSVGLRCDASIREDTENSALLDISIELSKVSGYVETYPIVTKRKFAADVSILSGGEYLLGQLMEQSALDSVGGSVLPTVFKTERGKVSTQVWAKAFRVAGPALASPPGLSAEPATK